MQEKSLNIYLHAKLNIKIIWQVLNEKHPECKVGYKLFTNYFKGNCYLRFGQPQVDVCCECELLKTKIKNPHVSEVVRKNDHKMHLEIAKKKI